MRGFFILAFGFWAIAVQGQTPTVVDPHTFTIETNPNNSNFEFYSRALGVNRRSTFDQVKKNMLPLIVGTPITYTPSTTGNSSNLGQVVTVLSSGAIWYIDGYGNGANLSSGLYGKLTVLAGTSTTSLIHSNTPGSTDVTIQAGSGVTLSESGNTITIANSYSSPVSSVNGFTGNVVLDLALSGNTLSLSGDATTVNLSPYMQTLTYDVPTSTMYISGGNSAVIPIFRGATMTIAGERGLVPKPAAGDSLKVLIGARRWIKVDSLLSGVGTGTVTSIGYVAPAAGVTITGTNPITGIGVWTFGLSNDLAALEGLSSTGIAVRTATDTWAQRTITAGTGISISNGNGVSGNPTITNTGDTDATDDVTTTGSVSPRVAYFDNTHSITGDPSLIYSGSILQVKNTDANTGNYGCCSGEENIRIQNTNSTNGNWSSISSYSSGGAIDGAFAFKHTTHSANEGYATIYTREATVFAEVFRASQAGSIIGSTLKVNTLSGTGTSIVGSTSGNILTTMGLAGGLSIVGGTLTMTEVDGSVTNEGSITAATGNKIHSNTSGSSDVTLAASTGISLSTNTGTNTITVTNSAPDQTVAISGAGIVSVTGTYPSFTVTGTEVDGSTSNEGSLTVNAGTSSTSVIHSNTAGSTDITLSNGTGVLLTESGNTITISADPVGTNYWTKSGSALYYNSGAVYVGATSGFGNLTVSGINGTGATGYNTWLFGGSTMAGSNTMVELTGTYTGTGFVNAVNAHLSAIGGNTVSNFGNDATSGTSGAIVNIGTKSGSTGNPVLQLQRVGNQTWGVGLDASNGNRFKISNGGVPGVTDVVDIIAAGHIGFSTAPDTSLVAKWGIARPLALPSCTIFSTNTTPFIAYDNFRRMFVMKGDVSGALQRPLIAYGTPTLTPQTGAGTGATATISTNGNDLTGVITFKTGSAGMAAGAQILVTFSHAFNQVYVVTWSAGSGLAAGQANNFFIDDGVQTNNDWTISVNTALPPLATYRLNYSVRQ